MKSHSISCASPSVRKRIFGFAAPLALAKSCTLTSSASTITRPPAAARASNRSATTLFCGYTMMQRPPARSSKSNRCVPPVEPEHHAVMDQPFALQLDRRCPFRPSGPRCPARARPRARALPHNGGCAPRPPPNRCPAGAANAKASARPVPRPRFRLVSANSNFVSPLKPAPILHSTCNARRSI